MRVVGRRLGEGRRLGFAGDYVLQPVAVDVDGGGVPGALEGVDDGGLGKKNHDVFVTVGERLIVERGEKLGGEGIEISRGHGGIGFAFARQVSLDVAAVFFEQRERAVFGMSLEVDEEAFLFLLYEEVDACVGGLREYFVSGGLEFVGAHFVPTRVRESK